MSAIDDVEFDARDDGWVDDLDDAATTVRERGSLTRRLRSVLPL